MPAIETPEDRPHPRPAVPVTTEPAAARTGSGFGSTARKLGLGLILLGACAFGYWKLQGNKKELDDTANKAAMAANRAIPVTAAPIVSKTMPIYLTALGTVTAYNTVTVKSRVDGQLMSVPVREGQQVKQGQVLATIDPRPYAAQVAQAEGQLTKDQASAKNAEAEAGRYTALYQAGVVSKESQQLQVTNAGVSNGTLEADRAAIQAAKVNVGYARITSPINGVVGLRQVDAGNIVHASDASGLLVVTQLQPIAVIFTLPEDQLPTVIQTMRAGKALVVDAYDRSEVTHLASGKLLTLDNQIDTTTGTVKAKAIFDNKDGALFPNQFVNIRLVLEQRENSLVMPASALQTGSSGAFVYVVKPGNPPKNTDDDGSNPVGGKGAGAPGGKGAGGKRPGGAGAPGAGGPGGPTDASEPPAQPFYVDVQNVVVDLTEGSQVILKSGVKPGDQVVIDGQEKLKKYSKVSPKTGKPAGRGRGGAGATAGADPNAAPDAGPHGGQGTGQGPGQPAGQPTGQDAGSPGQPRGRVEPGASGNAATSESLAPPPHKHGGKPRPEGPQ